MVPSVIILPMAMAIGKIMASEDSLWYCTIKEEVVQYYSPVLLGLRSRSL